MPILRQFFYSWLSVLDRYLLRELTLNLLAVTSVLWLIYLSTRFARYLGRAAVGDLPSDAVFTLLGYSSLSVLPLILPVGSCLAVMLVLGRMSADNELTVIAACGVSDKRIMRTVLLFAFLIAVIVAILTLVIRPNVLSHEYQLRQSIMTTETTGLIAGNFKESHKGNWTFYSQSLSEDKQDMKNVFIQVQRKTKPLIFKAEKGHFKIDNKTKNRYLILQNGYRYEGQAGDRDFIISKFKSHSMLIEKGGTKQRYESYAALPTSLLWQHGDQLAMAELQWRVSFIIMTVVLALLAFSFTSAEPRQGRYTSFFPVILLYIIYSNLTGVIHSWIGQGKINPWLGMFSVHLLMIIVLIILLNRHKFRYWLKYNKARKLTQ